MPVPSHDVYEIARHIGQWFSRELQYCLRIRSHRQAVDLLNGTLDNLIHQGVFAPSSGPSSVITASEWYDRLNQLGMEEMIRQRYFRLVKHSIPERYEDKLAAFYSMLVLAIMEVYSGREHNWILDFNDGYGHWLSEWVAMNKSKFQRAFWRIWYRERKQGLRY